MNDDHVPEVYVECSECCGEGHWLRSITVYEPGCGFSHPDVEAVPCGKCLGTGGFICDAPGDRP